MTTVLSTTTTALTQRAAGVAGLAAAAVLALNAAKRAQVIPTSAVTQLLAPLAEVFAIALVTGLYLIAESRLKRWGAIAFAIQFTSLALLVGVEFVINLVFAQVDESVVADLRNGPLGVALTVTSALFLIGTIGFALALAATGLFPRAALALYAVAAIPVALRAFVPEALLNVGLALLAAAVAWLSICLLRYPAPSFAGAARSE